MRAARPRPAPLGIALPGLLCLLCLGGCQRPRPTAVGAIGQQALERISLSAPAAKDALSSPVTLRGSAHLRKGQGLVGMVHCLQDAQEHHCGNAPIPVAADGSFAGEVPYSWPSAGPGIVEIAVFDPAQGVVIERRRLDVQLAASP